MPSPYIKKVAKEIGKSINDVEKHWAEAKKIASENLGVPEDKFGDKEYAYTTGIVKNMLGIKEVKEETNNPSFFIESDMDADEFLETLTSGSFPSLDKHLIPPDEEEDEDEEEEEIRVVHEKKVSVPTVSEEDWGKELERMIDSIGD